MAETSKIEWTDSTWSPITGCTLASPGCQHCYAADLAATRLSQHPSRSGLTKRNAAGVAAWTGEVRLNTQWLDQPLRWRRPRKVFVCAHADLFHEAVPDEWIDRVFAVMALAPQHTFQVLTKRAARMREYVLGLKCDGARRFVIASAAEQIANNFPIWDGNGYRLWDGYAGKEWDVKVTSVLQGPQWPLPNVWLGVSAEDQQRADERIPDLLATPAAIRFVSLEPLLGPVDLTAVQALGRAGWLCPLTGDHKLSPAHADHRGQRLDWIIVGSESGRHARPCNVDWVRSIRDQCVSSGVPLLWKQHVVAGKKVALPELDGRVWKEFPNNGR
ncbi:phage Gp37/Gp68 family protein [Cereibacter sphaeroides]|uniref:Phage Gp37/Gp68 family protein n=1 Tax=Cereibacter sphaeroides TaxID=1063 RepID=A0AAX1UNA4_CERSP|nr:phage Gp37/Gp68 family protein [Cereibacter sphaeroides]RHZ96496.1 phage Gp37/Gp68 family protein [Cereibacter sphaeroides]